MATVVPVPARELLNAPGLTTAPLGDAPAGGDAAVGEAEGNNGAAGAASGERGRKTFADDIVGFAVSGYAFGDVDAEEATYSC